MAELSNELKNIKKQYGENFMKLCRELFPTILETENLLYSMLTKKFSDNCKTLCEDITEAQLEGEFKDYIYSLIDVEKKEEAPEDNRTPYEILDEAGYILTECHSEDEIQSFKKYYKDGEQLCTFKGNRLDKCEVFFAVRKDVDNVKREDFKEPKREDKYGTSVMSVQFSRQGKCTVSIKNRYNHTVNNPDATYGNDLNKIAPGLEKSFARLLKERGLFLDSKNKEKFAIPNYVVASDGKYYRYNMEINRTYYCPGNIVIDGENIQRLENPEKNLLIDYFVVDTEKKTISTYDSEIQDSFVDDLTDLERIEIRKNKEKSNSVRDIIITKKGRDEPITVQIDKNNNIIGYTNLELSEVGDNFLFCNIGLIDLNQPLLKKAGDAFLYSNLGVKKLSQPSLEEVRSDFFYSNVCMNEVYQPKLKKVRNNFFYKNEGMPNLSQPSLEEVGNNFFYSNVNLTEVDHPRLKKVKNNFFYSNKGVKKLNQPLLEEVEDNFFYNNQDMTEINQPLVEVIGDSFCFCNKGVTELSQPKVEIIERKFFYSNEGLKKLEQISLRKVDNDFFYSNLGMTSLNQPSLEYAGDNFFYNNKGMTLLNQPKLKEAGNRFCNNNECMKKLNQPLLTKVKNYFFYMNNSLTEFNGPELKEIGIDFFKNNSSIRICNIPNKKEEERNLLERSERAERRKNKSSITAEDIATLDKDAKVAESEIGFARKVIDKIRNIFRKKDVSSKEENDKKEEI